MPLMCMAVADVNVTRGRLRWYRLPTPVVIAPPLTPLSLILWSGTAPDHQRQRPKQRNRRRYRKQHTQRHWDAGVGCWFVV